MGLGFYANFVLTVAAFTLPALCNAQKFQNPTKEELQMTSEPKAPGAPAVFLYREETTDNHSHYISEYARIKVLTEKGKEWATVEVPYVAILNAKPIIEGRTIHSDGTVIPLDKKAADLLVYKTVRTNQKAAVFNLPSVELGSILEYKWTIPLTGTKYLQDGVSKDGSNESAAAGQLPDWAGQQRIYVRKEHFSFDPNGGTASNLDTETPARWMAVWVGGKLDYVEHLPSGFKVVVSIDHVFTLDLVDVPAIQDEEYAPPLDNRLYRVRFYVTPYPEPSVYWKNESERWLKELNGFAVQSSTIKEAASQITTGAETAEARARKLYDAVQSLENTDFSRVKSESERKQLSLKSQLKNVGDIWSGRSGDHNDIAALYLALARAAGLDARALQVVDRSVRDFDSEYLTLQQLDALLVVLRIDGKDIYLDPGEKLCPFGQLHWKHTLAGGLEEGVNGIVDTPRNLSKDAITSHFADLTVDAHGAVTGTVRILLNGPQALYWRQLNLTTDPEEIKRRFNESLNSLLPDGVAGELIGFQGLDTSEGYLAVAAKVYGRLGSPTGKRMLLPGFFFSTGAHALFVAEEKRTAAVDLHFAEQVIDDAIYHLPAGYTVESAPLPAQLPWPEHAVLVVKTAPGPGGLDIKHIFARAFVLLDPKEYPALRDYYQKIAANDQQQLVLTSVGAPGN